MGFKIDFVNAIQDGNIVESEWNTLFQDHSDILNQDTYQNLRKAAQDYSIETGEIDTSLLGGHTLYSLLFTNYESKLDFRYERAFYLKLNFSELPRSEQADAQKFIQDMIVEEIRNGFYYGYRSNSRLSNEDGYEKVIHFSERVVSLLPTEVLVDFQNGRVDPLVSFLNDLSVLDEWYCCNFILTIILAAKESASSKEIMYYFDLQPQERISIYQSVLTNYKGSLEEDDFFNLLKADVIWADADLKLIRDDLIKNLNLNSQNTDLDNVKEWVLKFSEGWKTIKDISSHDDSLLFTLDFIENYGWDVMPLDSHYTIWERVEACRRIMRLQSSEFSQAVREKAKLVEQKLREQNEDQFIRMIISSEEEIRKQYFQ